MKILTDEGMQNIINAIGSLPVSWNQTNPIIVALSNAPNLKDESVIGLLQEQNRQEARKDPGSPVRQGAERKPVDGQATGPPPVAPGGKKNSNRLGKGANKKDRIRVT